MRAKPKGRNIETYFITYGYKIGAEMKKHLEKYLKIHGHAPDLGGSNAHELGEGPDGSGADEKKRRLKKWKKRL